MLLFAIVVLAVAVGALVCACSGAFALGTWVWLLPLAALVALLVMLGAGFVFVMYLCKRVDQEKEQEQDDKFYRIVGNLIVESAFFVLRIRVKKSGMEKVPKDGRFLLICNHCNNSDPIILFDCFRAFQLAFISKRENKTMFVIGPMMHKLQCQLINRENDREALKTILKCIQIIKEDKASIGAFPEGGILVKDKLSHFRSGMFKIAQKANVPIVVCTLKGTSDLFHNMKRLKKTYIRLHLVDVIPAEEVKGANTVELGERIYQMMLEDLGPEYALETT